jgi:hypothetical protein
MAAEARGIALVVGAGSGTVDVLALGSRRAPVFERPRRGFVMCSCTDVSARCDRICNRSFTSSDSPNTSSESSAVQVLSEGPGQTLRKSGYSPTRAFLSNNCQPLMGVLGATNSSRNAASSFALTSSQGTRVRRSGGGGALGFPLGPKIFTSASETFRAQIHLFRRFAATER